METEEVNQNVENASFHNEHSRTGTNSSPEQLPLLPCDINSGCDTFKSNYCGNRDSRPYDALENFDKSGEESHLSPGLSKVQFELDSMSVQYLVDKKRRVSCESTSPIHSSHSMTYERRAPDGGWGWVIVVASFLVHCIADGVTMSFGVLFVEFLHYFQESKSVTSWVGSLFMAIPLLAGPLASVLTDRYGCKTVTIWGSVLAGLGFFFSAFSPSIHLLFLTVGIITGLGLALCYVAAIVIVAFYFEKKRSLATGISVAGSGIGTFIFAPLIQHLIAELSWRGSLIILSGVFFNLAVCGSLMRDLKWTVSKVRSSTPVPSPSSASSLGNVSLPPSSEELRKILETGNISVFLSPDKPHPASLRESTSLVLLPTFLKKSHALPVDILPCLTSKENAYEVVSTIYPDLILRSTSRDLCHKHEGDTKSLPPVQERINPLITDPIGDALLQKYKPAPHDISKLEKTCEDSTGLTQNCEIEKLNNNISNNCDAALASRLIGTRASIFLEGGLRRISCLGSTTAPPASLKNLRMNKQSMTYRGAMLNIHRYRLRASSCPNIYRNSMITIAEERDQNIFPDIDDLTGILKSYIDVSYCQNKSFFIFTVSNFILYVFYDTVYMYLTDYAYGRGVSHEKSANLISIIGVLNCIGMVIMGYIGDRDWPSPMILYNVSMVACGTSIVVMPFLQEYWSLCIAAGVFGFFISANYALTSVILVNLVNLDTFSRAYGMLLLIQGIANLIGPPIVGLVADCTGEYLVPFVISGIFIIICGIILNLIPPIKQCSTEDSVSITPSANGTSV